jgi:hypothetical protein
MGKNEIYLHTDFIREQSCGAVLLFYPVIGITFFTKQNDKCVSIRQKVRDWKLQLKAEKDLADIQYV